MIDLRENAKWSLYIHIIPKAITGYDYDMYYVGITRTSLSKRWGPNGSNYRCAEKKNCFGNIIKKYGWDNIDHEIVATNLTASEAKSFEQTMIKVLQSHGNHGFNLTDGGDGVLGLSTPTSKIVYQFDIYGNFIEKYVSVNEASRRTGLSAAAICKYANKKRKMSGSTLYLWAYEDDVTSNEDGYVLKNKPVLHFSIYQFNLSGVFVARYPSIAEAARANHIDYDSLNNQLHNCTMRKLNKSQNYMWRRSDSVYFQNGTFHMLVKDCDNNMGRKVYQFDKNGCFISKYDSVREASLATEINERTIQYRASHRSSQQLLDDDYLFRYSKDVKSLSNGSFIMLE